MTGTAGLVSLVSGGAVLAVQVLVAALIVDRVLKLGMFEGVWTFCKKHGLLLGGLAALAATVGSLYFSEVVGLPVCKLCWLQRIAIYPAALMLLIAWWRNDREIWRYVVPLAAIGAFFALWHYALQMSGSEALSCGASSGADCAVIYLNEFGYITFPMLGLTTLILVGLLAYIARDSRIHSTEV